MSTLAHYMARYLSDIGYSRLGILSAPFESPLLSSPSIMVDVILHTDGYLSVSLVASNDYDF
jgi:hypothetical protein